MMKRSICLLGLMLCLILGISAALPAAAQVQPTIRVYLRKLDVTDSLHIQMKGPYMLKDGAMSFGDGTELTVVLRGNQLVLHTGKTAIVMGSELELLRVQSETPGGLYLAGEKGLYEGDLKLSVQNDVIRPILSIDVEDYLLGVVPYEMGDSFPMEALKAQAIAARTYALRKSGSPEDYDVEDTTNDQAYRGRAASSPLSEQAVQETRGIVGVYNGGLAQCYYSASNGGQTELGQHVWPVDEKDAYGYMDMRDDPYDLENPASVVRRYTVHKKPRPEGVGPALHSALVAGMAEQLKAMGVEPLDDLVRVNEVVNVEAITPRYEGDSRLMTELRFTLKISTRECTYRAPTPAPTAAAEKTPAPTLAADVTLTPAATADTTPAATADTTPAATASPTPAATASPTPVPTATPAYSPFKRVEEPLVVTLPYFPEAERAMGLGINITKNELVTVQETDSAFLVEARRFGHGVGMSQRGAEQMAREHGMTYEQILAFYYPGMEVSQYDFKRTPLPELNMSLMATPAPTASPTPRPTLMPVTAKPGKGEYLAVVANISDDSTLNLRQEMSYSSDVLRRLYKGQILLVLSSNEDGWAHVKTDAIEGYVREEFLQTAEK